MYMLKEAIRRTLSPQRRAALYRFQERSVMAVRHTMMLAGIDTYMSTEDRHVLERMILPYFSQTPGYDKVLFIGCEWHTRGYRRLFAHREYWTLDIDPEKARYGAKRHIVDSVANIETHFAEGALDLILCNGVFGWGLNDRAEVNRTFRGCHRCLREGGVFVLGWNDVDERRPFHPAESEGLRLFEPYAFPPLGGPHLLTNTHNRHTYDFYRRPRLQDAPSHATSRGHACP